MGVGAFISGASDWLKAQDTGGFVKNPPMTQTVSAHSITIKSDKGIKIGRIQSWSVNLARVIDTNFEVQANATGEPIERVPQIQGTNSINIDRYELYTAHLGEAFGILTQGGSDMYTLTQQIKPFHVREIWRDPFGDLRAYLYANCWFSSMGTTIAASDDRIVKTRATIEFMRKVKLA